MADTVETRTVAHEGMVARFLRTGRSWNQVSLSTDPDAPTPGGSLPWPPFQAAAAGRAHGFSSAMTGGHTPLPPEMACESFDETAGGARIRYRHPDPGLVVEVVLEGVPGANVWRCRTIASNEGHVPLTLLHLSSMCMNGIATGGLLPWHDPRKVRVHYCLQTWEGEGQWRVSSLEELGVHPVSVHPETGTFQVASVGSQSTARFWPMAVVEDQETGISWYFQVETSACWHYEIGCRGSWEGGEGALYLHGGAASERLVGWSHRLRPGKCFESVPAAVGCCNGGFDEAVRELTRYRRTRLKPAPAWEGECPVFFNDYMNCLWGNPTRERLEPLVDAAADAGIEGFVIDAGWFAPRSGSWGAGLGDWRDSPDRFGPEGVPGMLAYIRDKGLIPGLWLEMEVCGADAELAGKPDDWFLRRHGARVGGGPRMFLNFTNPEVRGYMHSVIDRLAAMGVGFVKNDYNDCIGPGDDTLGASAPDELLRHVRAFYAFIDEVRARHPRLILENCGGGAMRSDYGIMSHFHLQSSSDQEIHHLYPSIVLGSLAQVLPEQLGVWAFPLPHLFLDREDEAVLESEAWRARAADGEETIFNMVTGICGSLYLSGRIDKADALNMGLIREGVTLYKAERLFIRNSHPVWPLGMNRINDRESWAVVGLADDAGTRLLLAVWRRDSARESITIPIAGWAGRAAGARQAYPAEGFDAPYAYSRASGTFAVTLTRPRTARLFELRRVDED